MSRERPSDQERSVDEGVAIMRAWAYYLGVDEMTTTLIVPPDFVAGFRAGLAADKTPPSGSAA